MMRINVRIRSLDYYGVLLAILSLHTDSSLQAPYSQHLQVPVTSMIAENPPITYFLIKVDCCLVVNR